MAVLSEADQKKYMAEYDKWVRAAESLPLDPEEVTGTADQRRDIVARNKQADAAYNSNPGHKILADAYAEVVELNLDPHNGEGKKEFEKIKARKRVEFEQGLKDGPKDPPNFSKAFDHLMNFNIPKAIREAILAIPVVGDIIASLKDSMGSLFAGNPISPFTAFQTRQERKALLGAAERMGVSEKEQAGFIATAMNGSVADVPADDKTKAEKAAEVAAEAKQTEAAKEPQKPEEKKAAVKPQETKEPENPAPVSQPSIAEVSSALRTAGVGLQASSVVTGPVGNILGGLVGIAGSMMHVDSTPANASTTVADTTKKQNAK